MKTSSLLLPLACLALVACSKPAEPVAQPAESTPAAASPSVSEVPAKTIAKAEAMVAEIEAKSATVAADATKLFNDTMSKAKSYLGDKKFDLALTTLDSLKGVVLSEEQQKLASDLRAQINKAQDLYKQAQGAKGLLGK